MDFKLERYAATYEDVVVATSKTLVELKEKLACVEVSNLYPSFNIYEVKIKQLDRVYLPHNVATTDKEPEKVVIENELPRLQ